MQSAQTTSYHRESNTATYPDPQDPQPYPAAAATDAGTPNHPMISSPLGINMWPGATGDERSRAPSSVPATGGYDGHGGYPFPEEAQPMTPWSSEHLKPSHAQQLARPLSAPTDCFAYGPHETGAWGHKHDDALDLDSFVGGMHGNSPSYAINNESILDLRIPSGVEENTTGVMHAHSRQFSGSSSSVSSNGPVGENLAYEDFSSTYHSTPEASDLQSREGLNHPSTTLNSSVTPHPSMQVTPPRAVTRARAGSYPTRPSSSSHASATSNSRFAPYSLEQRRQHWSPESSASTPARQWSPLVYKRQQRFATTGGYSSSYPSPPPLQSNELPYSYGPYGNQQIYRPLSQYPNNGLPYAEPHQHVDSNGQPMMSHGIFRMLQSNADPISHHRYRYADLSDPPDLFASLQEKQNPPPEEDMHPSNPDLVPHEQELRFEGDLYTPRWVRGHGNKREGWCGICKPGRWLVLKNSAFWYDKSFSHGVSAATGAQFQEPQDTRRMDGNPDVWEGLCGSCNEWVALVSSKKKGTTWFRHAYKCHTHLKVKDAPKRKRESSHTRSLAASTGTGNHSASPSPPRSVPVAGGGYPLAPATRSMSGYDSVGTRG
ncbi:MAG: hypothetical protein M1838_001421 [Thelocarpon superellum]|nr:MAG: hypothetical protein M1838_001421 [Thelocarpon superellum]